MGKLGFAVGKERVHPDSRGRVTLGDIVGDADYRVLVNDQGQILLDPIATITLSGAWLWENPASRASMERALQQAERGEFQDRGSFAEYMDEDAEG